MSINITMPALSPTMEEGKLAKWHVKVGDTVAQGQTLMIIEAMKTMNPVPAPRAGKVVELLVGDSQPVEFGEPLIVIE